MEGWLRPALIRGAVVALVLLNTLEFKAKRCADTAEMDRFSDNDGTELWFARTRHATLQNIEEVLHIVNTVLIAILIAIRTA